MRWFKRASADVEAPDDTAEELSMADQNTAAQDEGAATPTTLEDLDKKVDANYVHLTKRVADINTALSDTESKLTSKVDEAVSTARKVKTTADNNADMIKSYSATIDRLERDNAKLRSENQSLVKRLDDIEEQQGAINTSIVEAVQKNRDFTLSQFQAATDHADKAVAAVDKKLDSAAANAGKQYDAVKTDLAKLRDDYETHEHTVQTGTSRPTHPAPPNTRGQGHG